MKVFVTGATGLLGQSVVKMLHDHGHETRVLVHATAINRNDPMAETEIVWGDITRQEYHVDYLKGCDAVVHCAWNFIRGDDVDAYQKENIDPAIALMGAAVQQGITRFITISSVSVYGLEPALDGHAFVETDDFCSYDDAMDVYPRAKQQSENLMRRTAEELGISMTIIRPGLLYSDKVAPVKKMIKGKVALLAGMGNNFLPYVHVDTVSDLIVKVLETPASLLPEVEVLNAVPSYDDTSRAVFRRWKKQQASSAIPIYLPAPAFKLLALAPYLIKKALKKNAIRPNAEYQTKTGTRNVDYSAKRAEEKYGWIGH